MNSKREELQRKYALNLGRFLQILERQLEEQAKKNPASKELADRLLAREQAKKMLKLRMLPDDDW